MKYRNANKTNIEEKCNDNNNTYFIGPKMARGTKERTDGTW